MKTLILAACAAVSISAFAACTRVVETHPHATSTTTTTEETIVRKATPTTTETRVVRAY